jgi:hypothetical protein
VALGLILLYTRPYRIWDWNPPFHAPKGIVLLFLASNLFLVLVPFFPPIPGSRTYERLPYWVSVSQAFRGYSREVLFIPDVPLTELSIPLFSRIRLAALRCPCLGLRTGMSGPCGGRRRKDISSSASGSFNLTACHGMRSVRFLWRMSQTSETFSVDACMYT